MFKREPEDISSSINDLGAGLLNDISIYSNFEKQLGRLLSPIELEYITLWVRQSSLEITLEALDRAVQNGKVNFKYIGAIILQLKKSNFQPAKQIEDQDSQSVYEVGKGDNEALDVNKRKELIKRLYY